MGLCLRGKMVDAGILPQPAVAIAAPVAAPTAEPAVASTEPAAPVPEPEVAAVQPDAAPAEPDVAIAEPELDVTPPAVTPAPDNLIAATFGLLRAEPDGSVVIAGSGTPGSEVEVYSNDQLLGKAKVEASGDWVLVPDAPIPPGGTELTLAEAGKPGRAAESFVVVVNDDKKSEPLVVASTPGAASDILQGLKRPVPGTTTEVAAAEPTAAVTAPVSPATSEPAADAAAAIAEPAPPADTPEAASDATATSPATTEPTAPAADVAVTEPTAAEASPEAETAATPEAIAPAETAVAAADPVVPVAPQPEVALANVPPTIDAIEIEGDKSFFAGGGPEGAIMRLYVDGTYIADATVADGRWLVEAGKALTKPNQRIRIDMLKPDTADVAARAEVDFQIELPAEKPTAVAEAEPAVPAASEQSAVVTPPETAPAADVAAIAAPTNPPAADDKAAPVEGVADTVTPATTAEDKSGVTQNQAAPTEAVVAAKPAEQAAAAIDNTAKPETEATAEAVSPEIVTQPEVTPAPVETAKADTSEPVAPVVASEATAPTEPEIAVAEAAPAEPAIEDNVPTMVAVAIGDPETARFASGKAIIRRGDNLWTIARRVYGAGIKYTTIYEANNGQIRNPNRIYPGQVFELPDNSN